LRCYPRRHRPQFLRTDLRSTGIRLLIIAIIWPIQKRLQVWLPKLVALVLTMVGTVVVVTEFASLITWGHCCPAIFLRAYGKGLL
jgi:hypothetical protein